MTASHAGKISMIRAAVHEMHPNMLKARVPLASMYDMQNQLALLMMPACRGSPPLMSSDAFEGWLAVTAAKLTCY